MIIGSRFRDDNNKEVMRLQHEVYGDALRIISGTCQKYTNLAHRILGDPWVSVIIDSYDHRTLQDSHDTIAAAWCSRCLLSLRQMELALDWKHAIAPDFQGHWLKWLEEEVRSWKDDPCLIQFVVRILENQNNPVGYRAEAYLNRALVFRYADVPWHQYIIDAVRRMTDAVQKDINEDED